MYSFILWNISPEIFNIGSFSLRWYGLLFAVGFLIGQQLLIWMYKKEGKNPRDIESLTVYMLIATVVGARLGHCLFYEPDYFLQHPLEILYIWQGGLASHGAGIGILIALYLYSRKHEGQSYLYVLDRIVIGVAIGASLIRLGNLMNSEIIGKPSTAPSAFLFVNGIEETILGTFGSLIEEVSIQKKDSILELNGISVQPLQVTMHMSSLGNGNVEDLVDYGIRKSLMNSYDYYEDKYLLPEKMSFSESTNEKGRKTILFTVYGVPRHPAQLYESISCMILFFILLSMYIKHEGKLPEGRTFGWFIAFVFSLRFCYEFLKENQVGFENNMALNMGQILSIPLVLVGVFVLIRSYKTVNSKQ